VLLVDDAADERDMYAECLRRQGFCTLQAENAAEGFRLAAELAPDVVVTDIRLLGHADGLELTRRLKAAPQTAAMPVVVLSGSAYPQDRQAATHAGCDLFLSKPCLPDELAQALAGILVTSQQFRAAVGVHGAP
jgi:CheY-like chemotaxis protein